MKAREVMSKYMECSVPSDSIRSVAEKMVQCDCGMIPVVDSLDSKHLLGIVTDRDIVCRVIATGKDCGIVTAQEAMSSAVLLCVKANDSIEKVIDLMENGRVRRIPVVDESNKILGIIALSDIADEIDEDDFVDIFMEVSETSTVPYA